MGVSTYAHTVKQHDIDELMFEVVKALKAKFGTKLVEGSVSWRDANRGKDTDYIFFDMQFVLDYENSDFSNNKECRQMSIFHQPKTEMKRDFYQFYLGAWGHNKEIANCLVDYFGGYANYSDCDNIEIDYCVGQYQSKLGVKK